MKKFVTIFISLLLLCSISFSADVSKEDFEKKFGDFDGMVFVHFKIDEPKDFKYWMEVVAEIQPYGASFQNVGKFYANDYGEVPKVKDQMGKSMLEKEESTDEIDKMIEGTIEEDGKMFKPKKFSKWIKLPRGSNAQWNITFYVRPDEGSEIQQGMKLHFEFATKPDTNFIFHVIDEELSTAGEAGVLMPCGGGLSELNRLMTFNEWAKNRLAMTESAVKNMGPPPRLKKIEVATGNDVSPTRWPGGLVSKEKVETEFKIMELLGINGMSAYIDSFRTGGISDSAWSELAPKYGILHNGFRAWGGPIGWQSFNDKEKLWDTYKRVNDENYKNIANQNKGSLAFKLADFVNLGDEIGPAIDAGYLTVPILKKFFHEYLQEQGLKPEFFGKSKWEEVDGLDDRALTRKKDPKKDAKKEDVRRFYWTRRFANYYTAIAYKSATDAVLKYFPSAKIVTVNLQAGPAQVGFLGNSNDWVNVDIFEFNDMCSFKGLQLEDWTNTNDFGVGQICFSSDLIRAGARKNNGATRGLLVGWWISPRLIAWLMQGCKNIELYSYGPVTRIGPAWGDSAEVGEVADGTRLIGKFDEQIYEVKLKTTKSAILVANTSDIMQVIGLQFGPERQLFYIALKHGYLHTDFISEQDILNDNILNNYKVLYVIDPQVRTEVQKKISDWVKDGGNLWVSVNGACWNEYNELSNVLDKTLGCENRSVEFHEKFPWSPAGALHTSSIGKFNYPKMDTITVDGKSFIPAMEFPVFGLRTKIKVTTGEVMGRYADGSPAVLHNKYGKGSAMLVGALIGEAYSRMHWQGGLGPKQLKTLEGGKQASALAVSFAEKCGVEKVVECSVPGVYSSLMESDTGYIVFLVDSAVFELKDLEIRIKNAKKIKKVVSARHGDLKFRMEESDAVIINPRVTYTEIIWVEKEK